MRRFRVFTALLLALLWLPATLHCGLEAAEILADHCADGTADDCSSDGEHCTADSCGMIEDADYRGESRALDLAPPSVAVCACLLCLAGVDAGLVPEETIIPPEGWDHPRDWVPAWAFERRAAAPAQAPNTLIA